MFENWTLCVDVAIDRTDRCPADVGLLQSDKRRQGWGAIPKGRAENSVAQSPLKHAQSKRVPAELVGITLSLGCQLNYSFSGGLANGS